MNARRVLLPVAFATLAAGCLDNDAPGNDREAALDPPAPAAEVVTVVAATEGVATALLFPQTMTDADLRSLPDGDRACLFRFTTVGLPVLAYGSTAVIKLNDRLVQLPRLAEGRYAEGPVDVTVRPLEDSPAPGERFEAELVLRLADAPDELGYHGFSTCDGARAERPRP